MFILVTGGSGSGKSEYAENRAVELAGREGRLIYLATMYPFDQESHRRIARHRVLREGKHFTTLEQYTGLKNISVPLGSTVLLECMSNLAANELYQPGGAGEEAAAEIRAGIQSLRRQCTHLVVVSNEIFSDGIPYDPETQRYQRVLGEVNRYMAGEADQAVEVVYGIPLIYKGMGNKGKP